MLDRRCQRCDLLLTCQLYDGPGARMRIRCPQCERTFLRIPMSDDMEITGDCPLCAKTMLCKNCSRDSSALPLVDPT